MHKSRVDPEPATVYENQKLFPIQELNAPSMWHRRKKNKLYGYCSEYLLPSF